jgi:hypothetical protein
MRLKGLAATFNAEELLGAAEEALVAAPGDPKVLRQIDVILARFSR